MVAVTNLLYDFSNVRSAKGIIEKLLGVLAAYAEMHFFREEQVFEQIEYKDTLSHVQQHRDFTKEVEKFQNQFKSGESDTLPEDVLSFLKNWLIHHIMGSDKAYEPHMKAKGIS